LCSKPSNSFFFCYFLYFLKICFIIYNLFSTVLNDLARDKKKDKKFDILKELKWDKARLRSIVTEDYRYPRVLRFKASLQLFRETETFIKSFREENTDASFTSQSIPYLKSLISELTSSLQVDVNREILLEIEPKPFPTLRLRRSLKKLKVLLRGEVTRASFTSLIRGCIKGYEYAISKFYASFQEDGFDVNRVINEHEVFLSFRGDDTRASFTSHLHASLQNDGISVFMDEDSLLRGNHISSSLLRAIEDTKISVVVFSRNYAESRWCLEELVKIMSCQRTVGQVVLPVFYGVDPSEVRHQTGEFGEAFRNLLDRISKGKKKKSLKWREALRQAAALAGFVVLDAR
ncbi:uncharacterized protein LOC131628701, partial [Vicia villosa]|uniref:uncharacterized protein LOC131628701 n=1 Tax=Vicia villosa TaxID=3911 RepID=UPI00273C8531